MNYSFEAKTFRQMLDMAVSEGVDTSPLAQEAENSPERLLDAMRQAIDVMARAEADVASDGDIGEKDITEIGDYVMTLIEGLLGHAQTGTDNRSMTQVRALIRLTLPVAMWVAKCGGRLDKLDLVVNALADYANELRQPEKLAELTQAIAVILPAVSDAVRQDLEQTNPMRPWRILHLNYCIIATRSHDPELIETAYDVLVKNLPQDARSFFKEGLQQMDAIGYPESVREVLERYDKMWGAESTLH
ncbi:MAG: hypothetical protein KAJ92_00635 [Gammaproteobacteria bacterium]|nr:hypothetical protein [Gammaproteobacteria bacterium]MCK5262151.1 hypothetical protein [Gammaproteobacteria bacterium]